MARVRATKARSESAPPRGTSPLPQGKSLTREPRRSFPEGAPIRRKQKDVVKRLRMLLNSYTSSTTSTSDYTVVWPTTTPSTSSATATGWVILEDDLETAVGSGGRFPEQEKEEPARPKVGEEWE